MFNILHISFKIESSCNILSHELLGLRNDLADRKLIPDLYGPDKLTVNLDVIIDAADFFTYESPRIVEKRI